MIKSGRKVSGRKQPWNTWTAFAPFAGARFEEKKHQLGLLRASSFGLAAVHRVLLAPYVSRSMSGRENGGAAAFTVESTAYIEAVLGAQQMDRLFSGKTSLLALAWAALERRLSAA